MANAKNLKGQVDPQGHFKFYVFPHLPEAFRAARAKHRPKVQEVQAKNEGKPPANREKTHITGKLTEKIKLAIQCLARVRRKQKN